FHVRSATPLLGLVLALLIPGCMPPRAVTWSVEFLNNRQDQAHFSARLMNATGATVWSFESNVSLHQRLDSQMSHVPPGVYFTRANAANATCGSGPNDVDLGRTRWFVELFELGRRSRIDGSLWDPSRLNCSFETST